MTYKANPSLFGSHPLYFLLCVLLIAVGIGLVILLVWWLYNRTIELTVEEGRVWLVKGLLSRQTTEIDLDSIRTVKLDQSLFERMVGVCSLKILTAGDTPELAVGGLPRPDELREALRRGGN